MTMRIQEEGWIEIGKRCSANRRSTWLRFNFKSSVNSDSEAVYLSDQTVESIELCAGREGDDSYVKIDQTNPQFAAILDLVTTSKFAAET